MGNRALVIFDNGRDDHPHVGVYLHWNGGPESVYAFLTELERRIGDRLGDEEYATARFVQVCGDFFDNEGRDGLSVGVQPIGVRQLTAQSLSRYSPGDNGIYVVTFGPPPAPHSLEPNDHYWVRRFVTGYGPDYRVRELTREQVHAEHHSATQVGRGEEYREGISALFLAQDAALYGEKVTA